MQKLTAPLRDHVFGTSPILNIVQSPEHVQWAEDEEEHDQN